MRYPEGTRRLGEYRERIVALRRKMRNVQKRIEPQPVGDYTFSTVEGPTRLSQLFGSMKDLFVVHNMGSACPYCTLWADGYNGIYEHLTSRAAFVVARPDPPGVQRRFARSRGWRFPMVSHQGTTFARDMGYRSRSGGWLPGISAFRRARSRIVRLTGCGVQPGRRLLRVVARVRSAPGRVRGLAAEVPIRAQRSLTLTPTTGPGGKGSSRWRRTDSCRARSGSRLACSTRPGRRSSRDSAID